MVFKNKKHLVLSLILLSIISSIVVFFAANLLLSDVANITYVFVDKLIFVSIPALCVSISFVASTIMVFRLNNNPDGIYQYIRFYGILLSVVSLIGVIFSILSGTIVYGSFLVPYPFSGYLILCIIINMLILIYSLYCVIKYSKNYQKGEKRSILAKILHGIYSFFVGLGVFLSFERFGALLYSPLYIQIRSLGITWIFYVSLLIPLAFVVLIAAKHINNFDKKKTLKTFIIYTIISFAVLFSVLMLNFNSTLYLSAVSPADSLDRLGCAMYTVTIEFVVILAVGIIQIIKSCTGNTKQ